MKQGKLIMHINELKDIHHHHICTEQYCMFYDSVVLATGFEDTLMQQPIIKQLVKILMHLCQMRDCLLFHLI